MVYLAHVAPLDNVVAKEHAWIVTLERYRDHDRIPEEMPELADDLPDLTEEPIVGADWGQPYLEDSPWTE